jgi:hypothetical protein
MGMGEDIESLAWSVRQLKDRPSNLYVDNEVVVAGGWDGNISCWDLDGIQQWAITLSSRIQSICRYEQRLYVAAGLNAVALNLNDGEILWSQTTEGSADAILCSSDGELIVAISSVYDIEYGDFMESACWQYSNTGELLIVERMDERPWFSTMFEGEIILGLGRPRGGYLTINGSSSKWTELIEDDPVTCGCSKGQHLVLGHAKGGLSFLEKGVIVNSKTLENGIEYISIHEDGYLLTFDTGGACLLDNKGKMQTESMGIDNALIFQSGLIIDGGRTSWLISQNNDEHILQICSINSGDEYINTPLGSLVTAYNSTDEHTVIGCEDGRILLFEADLLNRRLTNRLSGKDDVEKISNNSTDEQKDSSSELSEADFGALEKRRIMQAKLRKLRDN